MSLIRSPSTGRTPESLANKHEDWEIHFNESIIATFFALAAPAYVNRRVRDGIDALICGSPCRVKARSSYRSRRRAIDFVFPEGESLGVRRRGLQMTLEDQNGTVRARRSGIHRWETDDISERTMCAIAFVELSGVGSILSNPLLRNL
ncbi:hypothetical protein [Streptomyces albus]|uniref:hypothetical protein n=1 Tax=Streptomyces albus TaxID=1888 RepID=UPI00131BEE0B|nr:hypothetical protein [Streptomyces albus]